MPASDNALIDYIASHPGAGRSAIMRDVAPEVSATTLWRALKRLVDAEQLAVSGRGRATGYRLAGSAVVRAHLRAPHNSRRLAVYDRAFIDRYVPGKSFYLGAADRSRLHDAGRGVPTVAGTIAEPVLERLLVELSWASSRMEGNTYSLLETDRLIRSGEEAVGKNRQEAIMILNHKEAIQYVGERLAEISVSRSDLCNLHALLADGLLADPAMAGRLRRRPVAISHSSYRPLDNPFVIEEEFEILIAKAAAVADPFEQSFFLLVHIPYLQAFDDVNKRTSRIACNIPLLQAGLAPMSFLAMDDAAYIDGLIGVYELNDVSLLRENYVEEHLASAENHRALHAELAMPHIAALAHRGFVRRAVRRCVLEWRAFRRDGVESMALAAGIPAVDRDGVVDYVGKECRGLHEGNAIRYRLRPEDLAAFGGD